MSENKINYQEEVLKAGLLLGFVSVFITLITYIISIEMMTEWWFGLLSLAINISLIIYLGITFRKNIGGYMSFKESFKFSSLKYLTKLLAILSPISST